MEESGNNGNRTNIMRRFQYRVAQFPVGSDAADVIRVASD